MMFPSKVWLFKHDKKSGMEGVVDLGILGDFEFDLGSSNLFHFHVYLYHYCYSCSPSLR